MIEADNTDFIEIVTRPEVSNIYVVRVAEDLIQLDAHWLVLQPELFRADPTKGWDPVGGSYLDVYIGSEERGIIEVHPQDEAAICVVASARNGEAVEISNISETPVEIVRYKR